MAGLPPSRLADAGPAGPDLAALLQQIEQELDEGRIADRARLFAAATAAVAGDRALAVPLVLLDVAMAAPSEADFVRALNPSVNSGPCRVPGA